MINPIQQNVVFKGAQINSPNKNVSQPVSVREGYSNTLNTVAQISQAQNNTASAALTGDNSNTIAIA